MNCAEQPGFEEGRGRSLALQPGPCQLEPAIDFKRTDLLGQGQMPRVCERVCPSQGVGVEKEELEAAALCPPPCLLRGPLPLPSFPPFLFRGAFAGCGRATDECWGNCARSTGADLLPRVGIGEARELEEPAWVASWPGPVLL